MGRTIASITQTGSRKKPPSNAFSARCAKRTSCCWNELLVLSRLHLAEASVRLQSIPAGYVSDCHSAGGVYKQLKSLQKQILPESADPSVKLDSGKRGAFSHAAQ
jgi:hypothetical protein